MIKIKYIKNTLLIAILTSAILLLPILELSKATDIAISISWDEIDITNSYDNDNTGEFYLQVKYYSADDNDWELHTSSRTDAKSSDCPFDPDIYFTLSDKV